MADCECLETCIFFNDKMVSMPTMAAIMKQNYCKTNNAECARFIVFKALGKGNVPTDLFPNNVERAKRIVAGG
jgi:hypothetical protein